jgi:predicted GIY-YIG superfamily endonuclease
MSRRNVQGTIYLIHFSTPYKHAAHYMGWAEDLESRLADHHAGRGARLMAVIKAAGIGWKLTRTWKGDRYRERQLKNQGSSKRHCPECGVKPRKDTNMQTALTDKATPQEAAELQAALEHGYKKAYAAARDAWGRDPWGSDYQSRFQTAAECNEVAADVIHETLESGMRRPAEPTADFLSRTKAEAQSAAAKRTGPQTDRVADPVLGCDELGEYHASDDPLTDPANRQIFEEDTDRRLASRDVADRSLMEAAAAMRYSRPQPGLYELHACLDDGHLHAARCLIADAAADAQPEAEAG